MDKKTMIKKALAVNKIKAIIFDAGGVLYLRKGKFGYLNRELAQLIKTLRKDFQIKTALLSDTRLSTLPVILEKDKIENLFDIVSTSKEAGLQKTDPEIYELVCKRLGVSPQKTMLVDDKKEFILAAKSLGMTGIIFVSNDKLKRDLKAYMNMNPSPKIVFLGTPEFAVAPLTALFEAKYAISGAITAPDRPVGRKRVLAPPAVKMTAQKLGLPVYQPGSKAELTALLKDLRPDLCVVAAFGMILPKEALEIPKYGFLNIHASLLPRWRGPSPIQAAILAGDEKTGVTIMLINEKMDEGPVLAESEIKISNSETAEELSKKLSESGAELLVETLPKYLNGEIKPRKQNDVEATYCKMVKKEDGKIDWTKPAEYIERMTRAYRPWPGAFTELKSGILKIIKARIIKENGREAGEMFLARDKKPAVKCGEDSLVLETVQPEGKKPMAGEEFLRGRRDIIGSTSAN